jgi:hypothetical protein
MKRSIIILIALVLLVSLPVFASTPTQENAPAATSEDTMFLDMMQLSEEELMGVEGSLDCVVAGEGAIPELPPPPTVWQANKNSYDLTSAGTSTGTGTGGFMTIHIYLSQL